MIIDSPRCWLQRRAATVFIACRRPINTFLLRACCRGHGWNREKHRHSYIPHPVPWIFILNYALLCLVSNRDWHCAKDTWTWLFAFDSSHPGRFSHIFSKFFHSYLFILRNSYLLFFFQWGNVLRDILYCIAWISRERFDERLMIVCIVRLCSLDTLLF